METLEMDFWIDYNGSYFKASDLVFSINNRGFHYADGLFESMCYHKGQILFFKDHFERLQKGMQALKMESHSFFNPDFFQKQVLNLIQKNKLEQKEVRIKLNLFREADGLYTPSKNTIGYVLSLRTLEKGYQIQQNDYEVGIYADHKVPMDSLSNLKTTQKLINVLGSIYAKKQNWQNALLLNAQGNITEALNGNLFLVKGNTVVTPPLSEACLDGVMRKNLIRFFKTEGIAVEEKALKESDVLLADELWITNVVVGIQPIYRMAGKLYKDTLAQEMVQKLNQALFR